MIICPNCSHQNPEGATQCEACFSDLPKTTSCPECGALVEVGAAFCGQCGANLQSQTSPEMATPSDLESTTPQESSPATTETIFEGSLVAEESTPPVSESVESNSSPISVEKKEKKMSAPTQIQIQKASLLHIQTDIKIEIPPDLSVIHMGKPNEQIPPDIDVSGFPNSEVVSRVHADIRVEGDTYYIEDMGSSNGTYINHSPLIKGNRHRLRSGDRIALGKEDKVSFIFQIS